MPGELDIHPLRSRDREAWEPLWEGFLRHAGRELAHGVTDGAFARMVDPLRPCHGAVAVDPDGGAVGLVHWLTHPSSWSLGDYCYLEDLYVAPAARGRGVATALIEHVRGWAGERGCEKVYWVVEESNAPARALYDAVAVRNGLLQYEAPVTSVLRPRLPGPGA